MYIYVHLWNVKSVSRIEFQKKIKKNVRDENYLSEMHST